jgi:hypothetical protein
LEKFTESDWWLHCVGQIDRFAGVLSRLFESESSDVCTEPAKPKKWSNGAVFEYRLDSLWNAQKTGSKIGVRKWISQILTVAYSVQYSHQFQLKTFHCSYPNPTS